MAAHETRLLLLGAVALFEPVNGDQIRRELLSWQVDRWAHTNPGSIYHGHARPGSSSRDRGTTSWTAAARWRSTNSPTTDARSFSG